MGPRTGPLRIRTIQDSLLIGKEKVPIELKPQFHEQIPIVYSSNCKVKAGMLFREEHIKPYLSPFFR